jgi:Tol biopolymer transport system component
VIWGLTFSPDTNFIDFIRSEKNNPFNTYLYRIPTLGGTPRLAMQGGIDGTNSYSPDGTQFAFLRVRPDNESIELLTAKADGTNERVLSSRPYLDWQTGTAYSPDGKAVAFTTLEAVTRLRSVLWAVSVADGSVREVYSSPGLMGRPRWLPDRSGLVVPISHLEQVSRGQLWFISYPRGEAQRLTNDLMDYQSCCLDLTQDGKTLVEIESTTLSDLWLASGGDAAKAKQITAKEIEVQRFSWAPNGDIVIGSADGNLFSVKPSGTGRTLLTPNERENWSPSVCGDGRYIVYEAIREQKQGIWRMDADGSNPTRIADETSAALPLCSPDGQWVVYLRGANSNPARVPITGAKTAQLITPDSVTGFGYSFDISPDGKYIVYVAVPESPASDVVPPSASKPNLLKVMPFDGGTPLNQFDWPASAGAPRWAPEGRAIQYILTKNGVSNIWEQKLKGGPAKQVTNFQSGLIFDFHWSPDGKQLALTRGSQSSDVILISNFQ